MYVLSGFSDLLKCCILLRYMNFCFDTEGKEHRIFKSDDASVEFCFTYLEHLREVLVSAVSKPTVTQTYFIWGWGAAHLSLISKGKSVRRGGRGRWGAIAICYGTSPLL